MDDASGSDPRESIEELVDAITRYWESRRQPAKGSKKAPRSAVGGALRRVLSDLDLKPEQFARVAGVSSSTVSRWLNHEAIPRLDFVRSLASLRENPMAAESGRQQKIPEVWRSADISRRISYARRLCIFKWNRPFVTETDKYLKTALDQFLQTGSEDGLPRYYYLYPGSEVSRELQQLEDKPGLIDLASPDEQLAARSFDNLRAKLLEEYPGYEAKIDSLVRGIPLSLKETLLLGIPRVDLGFFMIEYRGDQLNRVDRPFDIFVEIDAPVSSVTTAASVQPQQSEEVETLWIRWSYATARALKLRWDPLLRILLER